MAILTAVPELTLFLPPCFLPCLLPIAVALEIACLLGSRDREDGCNMLEGVGVPEDFIVGVAKGDGCIK